MPCYNAEKVIELSVKSVINQSYQDWELLIIDDASSDNTTEIITKYLDDNRIKLIKLKNNKGVANVRNIGLKKCSGRYIAFLDCDDCWYPNKLEKQVEFLNLNDAFLVYSGYETFFESIENVTNYIRVPNSLTYNELLRNTIIGCLTVLIDKSKTGEFLMPVISGGEDTATWLNLLKKHGTAYGLKEPLAYYRTSYHSLSGNKFSMMSKTWKMYRRTQNLNLIQTGTCFVFYVKNAIKKRIKKNRY